MRESEIFNRYFELERDLHLFDKKVGSIYFWKLIRFPLVLKILELKGHLNQSHKRTAQTAPLKRRLLEIVNNSLKHSMFKERKQELDVLFIENPRKVLSEDQSYIDPFTHHYIEEFAKSNQNYLILDIGHKGRHFNPASKKRKYFDNLFYDLVYKVIAKLFPVKLNDKEKSMISEIEKQFCDVFDLKLSLQSLILEKLTLFKFQERKYKALFKRLNPKQVFLVCSYGKEGLISVAQSLGIEVIEFQHGVMGKYQLAYSYPSDITPPYFPDRVLLFGEYWRDSTTLPISSEKVGYYSHKYLTDRLKNYDCSTKKTRALYISQPGNSDDLISSVRKMLSVNPDYQFIYRLHPKERKVWKSLYPELLNLSELHGNLKVDDSASDLYSEISGSDYVFGVNSAAIFEALMLGSKVILIDSAGVSYMDYLIEQSIVMLIKKDESFALSNIDFQFKEFEKSYLYC